MESSIAIWFKRFETRNASRLVMERSALVIDFLETVIKKGYMQGIDSTKDAYLLNVTHGPQAALISHSTPLRDIGGSCLEWPLIIGQVDMCKY